MTRRIDWLGLTAATVTTIGAAAAFIATVAVLMYPVAQVLQVAP